MGDTTTTAVRASFLYANVSQVRQAPFDEATQGRRFDAWLAEVRAAAWDEGHSAGRKEAFYAPTPTNPYRSTT